MLNKTTLILNIVWKSSLFCCLSSIKFPFLFAYNGWFPFILVKILGSFLNEFVRHRWRCVYGGQFIGFVNLPFQSSFKRKNWHRESFIMWYFNFDTITRHLRLCFMYFLCFSSVKFSVVAFSNCEQLQLFLMQTFDEINFSAMFFCV